MDPTAPAAAPPGSPPAPSRRAWILAGAVASVVFIVFESVSAFIAVPLREISSILAQGMLAAIGFPVTRTGTILSTPKATFDVVPACSGSTTMQVLLFLTIVWCGVHPRLAPSRRILAIALAVPLAVLTNALRVSALVGIGHTIGGPTNDFFHGLTGLIAFALALVGSFGLTQWLSTSTKRPTVADSTLKWILGALLFFLSIPFLSWCLEAWVGRSLDRFGWIFVIAAVGFGGRRWLRAPSDSTWERAGTVGLGLSFLGLVASTLIDVNILRGYSLILSFLSLALALKGLRFAASMIPVALVAYLGFPTVSYQLGILTGWALKGFTGLLVLKAVLAAGLLGLTHARTFRASSAPESSAPGRLLPVQILMASILAAAQTYLFLAAGAAVQRIGLDMSYIQGSWVGGDLEPPRSELEYFGSDHIWSKRYQRGPTVVDVLVTSTGGDRHRAHPPAYCVTGAGWQPMTTSTADYRLGDGSSVPTTRMDLKKD